MSRELIIGVAVFTIILAVYLYAAMILGFVKGTLTCLSCLTILFSGFLFNCERKLLKVIAVFLNLSLIFIFFLPGNIKQGMKDLKEKENSLNIM